MPKQLLIGHHLEQTDAGLSVVFVEHYPHHVVDHTLNEYESPPGVVLSDVIAIGVLLEDNAAVALFMAKNPGSTHGLRP